MKSLNDIENILKGNRIAETEDVFTDKALKIIEKLKTSIMQYGKNKQSFTVATNREQFDRIRKDCLKLNNLAIEEYARLDKIGEYSSNNSDWKCKVDYQNGSYNICFNKLLPSRNCGRETINHMQNVLKEALLKVPLNTFTERVTIQVIHHFDKTMKDYDNLSFKAAIDVIALYLLKDDNPKYMSLYQDYIMDNAAYTEIIVSSFKDFIQSIDRRL